jgi:hypothetical protein
MTDSLLTYLLLCLKFLTSSSSVDLDSVTHHLTYLFGTCLKEYYLPLSDYQLSKLMSALIEATVT